VDAELAQLTAHWQKRPGASIQAIREREASLGFRFPADYVDFMLASNGGMGDKDEIEIEIDAIEEMAPDDQPLAGLPGVFSFGSDGSEETFAFDTRSGSVKIVMVRDSVSAEDVLWQGDTFAEFVRNVPVYRSAAKPSTPRCKQLPRRSES
jgi:hypothetical protein